MSKPFVATSEMIEEARRLYLDEGLSMQAIGDVMEISAPTVCRRLLPDVPKRRPGMRAGMILDIYAQKAEQTKCPICGILTDDGEECDACAGRRTEGHMTACVVEPLNGITWAGTFLRMRNPTYLRDGHGW